MRGNISVIVLTTLLISQGAFSTEMANLALQIPVQSKDDLERAFNGGISNAGSNAIADKKEVQQYKISNYHVNRIVTPFKNPSLKVDSVEGLAYKQVKNVIYLSTKNTRNIAAFITEKGSEDQAISVVFEPKRLPPQEIILGQSERSGSMIAKKYEKSQPRISTIKDVLSSIAKGELPVGYTAKNVTAEYIPNCVQSGFEFDFYNGQFYSGGDYVVSIGVIENKSSQQLEFKENNCHGDSVVATSAYPKTTLFPHERSEVFVMYQRNSSGVKNRESVNQRQSLLK